MKEPILQHGELVVAAYREWVGSQGCLHCGKAAPSEVHQFPGRGIFGVVFDLRICPLCVGCLRRASGEIIWLGSKRLMPIDADKQTLYVALTWQRFIERAPWRVVERVMLEVRRWREARVFDEVSGHEGGK